MLRDIRTDEDAFIYATKLLLEQNDKSTNEDATCMYRGYKESTKFKVEEEVRNNIINEFGLYALSEEDEFQAFRDALIDLETDAKCAVGYLISDFYYDSDFENRSVEDSDIWDAVAKSNPNWVMNDETSMNMLKQMQKIHDSAEVNEWPNYFEKMALKFDEDGKYVK